MTNITHFIRAERMLDMLTCALSPSYIKLYDESDKHLGHKGVQESVNAGISETHFILEITATALDGMTRIAQHQMIYQIFNDEFKSGLHALQIRVI